MAKPLVDVETIYDTALELLLAEGVSGLTARRLAAEVGCSVRTLYEQVGKRDELVTRLLDYHFARIELGFAPEARWQDSAFNWSGRLREALLVNPDLSRLMTIENRGVIADYTTQLLTVLLDSGFDEELALRACRVLVSQVMSLSMIEIETPPVEVRRGKRRAAEIRFEDLVIARGRKKRRGHFQDLPEVFENAIRWTITGIEQEKSPGPTQK